MQKKTFDMRGRQTNISRLFAFDREGFIHMVAYRALIFYSIPYGILLLLSFFYANVLAYTGIFTAIFWILITPQLFETAKAFSLISSRGLAFGHLSESRVFLQKEKYSKTGALFKPIPYIAMLLWFIGFIALLLWWKI